MKNLIKIFFLLISISSFAQNGTGLFGKVGVGGGDVIPTEAFKVTGSATVTGALKFNNLATGVLKSTSGTISSSKIIDSDISTSAAINYNKVTGLTATNIVALRAKSGAISNQLCNLLGYYTAGDGGGGDFYWNSASTATDNGGTIIQVTGVTTGRWIRLINNRINPKMFGAKLDGVTDDTTPIQNALNIASNKIINFDGNALVTNTLTFVGNNLIIEGNGYSISHTTAQNSTFLIAGLNTIYTTTNEIVENTNTITLTNTNNLVKGDVLYITANISDSLWTQERSYFYKGEFIEIDSVLNSTTIRIKSKTIDSYITSATLTRLNNAGVEINNLNFIRSNNTACLTISNFNNVNINNCKITGANERGLYIYNSYNVRVKDCNILGNYYTASNTSYGLCIASSQNVTVDGGNYIAGRHGITVGGTIPCRYLSFSNITVDNDPLNTAQTAAFDFHSNVQYATISNINSKNGITLSGINITITNSITSGRNYYPFLFLANRDGDNSLVVNGLDISSNSIYSAFMFTSLGSGSSYIINAGNVSVSNVIINSNTLMSSSTAAFDFAGSSLNNINYKNINISNISIFSSIEQSSSAYAMRFAGNSSTINSDAVINISNIFLNFKSRCFNIGSGNVNTIVNISNSYFKSYFSGATNYNSRFGIGTFRIDNTVFDGSNVSFVEGTGGNMSFTNCEFNNMVSYGFNGTNLTEIQMTNCTKNNSVDMFYQGGTSPKLIDNVISSNNARIITGSSFPITGTWAVGDVAYNTSPSIGANVGWICTTAGTPGTWTQFGIIYNSLEASITYNPPSLATLTQATNPMFVTNAALNDYVVCSFSNSLAGITLTGYVSSSGTITPVFFNGTSGTVDLASGTLKCKVLK
jgi:hypothetical protein